MTTITGQFSILIEEQFGILTAGQCSVLITPVKDKVYLKFDSQTVSA